jgi:hypothetical protein
MIDTTNQSQEYWEKILAAENLPSDLSLREKVDTEMLEITDEEFKELKNLELLPEEDYQYEDDPVVNFISRDTDSGHSGLSETNEELRGKVGSNDPFFVGHGIIKPQPGGTAKKTGVPRVCPEWAQDKSKLKALLLQSFPKLATDIKQRAAAGRWARIIQLYHRSQMTHGQVASEMGLSLPAIFSIIRSIDRAVRGKRADGSGRRFGKLGRPKKSCYNVGII